MADATVMSIFWFLVICVGVFAGPTPVVLWHGMGDNCCNPFTMGSIKASIERNIEGVYVKSLQIGRNVAEDIHNGYFMNANTQIQMACDIIANDANLKDGYHAVGFSQGGLFLRAVAQRCPTPPMLNLVSVGGQHQGIFGLPRCFFKNHLFCSKVKALLDFGPYLSCVQDRVVPATYWHDPLNEDEYRDKSIFLADINQERVVNSTYKINLQKLKKIVLVMFSSDTVVVPRESAWFGFYKPGQSKELYTLFESPLFIEDRLGLKAMYPEGKVHLLKVPEDHLEIPRDWFIDNIIKHFLQ